MLHDIIPTTRPEARWPQLLLRELRSLSGMVGQRFNRLWRRLDANNRRRRVEREFESLPNAILGDIGFARSDIARIAARPAERWRGGRDDPA
jgi:uncharacterized protein YjiS (DUF1127 family)